MLMEMQVTDCTVDGRCSGCGECCSNFLPMSQKEIQTIRCYVSRNAVNEQRHNVAVGIDATCPFRSESERKCLIYPVRPEICKSFQCNKKPEDLLENKTLFHERHRPIDMRKEFFGNDECGNLAILCDMIAKRAALETGFQR